ncbi:MAG: thiamine phosphate synthase [Candidatus Cloacimonetes bacterium]|nr:thiamine phosphate synthase [Candidatus Cloacimonadota bacterium]
MSDFGLYIIISDPVLPYDKIAEICVEEEIEMLQLRAKKLSDQEVLSIGNTINSIIQDSKTKLIINDRPDLAMLIGADGYHLGQDDLSLQDGEKLYPNAKIRGLSTHNLQQVNTAILNKPDYIGFGPIYATPTKENPDPVVGTEKLRSIISLVNMPVVAIGGIDESNIEKVLQTGVKNIAMVRYFMQSHNLKDKIQRIKAICEQYWR